MPIQEYFNNLYRGTVSSDEDGKYRGTGIGAALLKPLVDEQSIESGKQQGAVKRAITAAGENPADYNLGSGATVYDAQGAITTKRREREKATKEEDFSKQLGAITAGQKPQMAGIQAGLEESRNTNTRLIQQNNNQMELSRMQMAQSDKNRLADRIDAREARADELMFRRESMERADRRDEKNRRRESIQALVAGLSSLGAAFAV